MAKSSISLSSLFRNPAVRDAFERAERDNGAAFVILAPKSPTLGGGAARVLEVA